LIIKKFSLKSFVTSLKLTLTFFFFKRGLKVSQVKRNIDYKKKKENNETQKFMFQGKSAHLHKLCL